MLSQTARDRSVDVWNIIEHTLFYLYTVVLWLWFLPVETGVDCLTTVYDWSPSCWLRVISGPDHHPSKARLQRANCSRSRRLTLVWSGYHPAELPPALPHYRKRLAFSCLPRLGDCGWLCSGGQMVNELLCWSNTTCLCWVCEKHDIKACLSLPKFVVMNNVKACGEISLKSSLAWV